MARESAPDGEWVREDMLLDDVFAGWRPGSFDPPWSWEDERHNLWVADGHRLDDLLVSVNEEGIKEPVLLGSDGRVWDGHHRLTVAYLLSLDTVPVERWVASDPALIGSSIARGDGS